MTVALYALAFVMALSILVSFHELGHFFAARACGVKVLRFSLGFGKTIALGRFGADKTEWALSLIPLGGYVRMLDEREGEVEPAERHRSFNAQSLAKRSFIVAAGPLANFALAVLIAWGLACVGSRDLPPVIGEVTPGSVMEKAGVLPADKVLSVNGEPVRAWTDFNWQVLGRALAGEPLALVLERDGRTLGPKLLDASSLKLEERAPPPLRQLGVQPFLPKLPVRVNKVIEASPAMRAGLLAGDKVLSVGGRALKSPETFVNIVSGATGRPLEVIVWRAGQEKRLSVTPEAKGSRAQGAIGVEISVDPAEMVQATVEVRYGVFEGLWHGMRETWDMAAFSLRAIGRLLTGSLSPKTVSGPLTIADYAGQSASMGFVTYFRFLALLSVSIGVLNLLPVPILDGGHLLYHAAEFIRGRPLSERAEEWGGRVGMALLACLMVLALFNDFNRVFG